VVVRAVLAFLVPLLTFFTEGNVPCISVTLVLKSPARLFHADSVFLMASGRRIAAQTVPPGCGGSSKRHGGWKMGFANRKGVFPNWDWLSTQY